MTILAISLYLAVYDWLIPSIQEGEKISKVIYKTYSFHGLPKYITDKLDSNVNYLKTLNPGWEYKYFDDTGVRHFIKEN